MVARTPYVGGNDGGLPLKPLGNPQSFAVAGTFTVTAPAGAKYVRGDIRGGSGGGAGYNSGHSPFSGFSGGQGSRMRFFKKLNAHSFQITIGAGGAGGASGAGATAGGSGTPTTLLGLTANPGGGGDIVHNDGSSFGGGAAGLGADGTETAAGYGAYNGQPGGSSTTASGGTAAAGQPGAGSSVSTQPGQAGGIGTATLEFFG